MVVHAIQHTGLRSFPSCWELGLQSRSASVLVLRPFSHCMRGGFEYIDRAFLQWDQLLQHPILIFGFSPERIHKSVNRDISANTEIGVSSVLALVRGPWLRLPTTQRPDILCYHARIAFPTHTFMSRKFQISRQIYGQVRIRTTLPKQPSLFMSGSHFLGSK